EDSSINIRPYRKSDKLCVEEPVAISQSSLGFTTKRFWMLQIPTSPILWYWTIMLIATILFLCSIPSGGPIWDEPLDFSSVDRQISFAGNVLFGSTDWTFRSFPFGYAFYGIGTLFPAYVFSYLIDTVWLNGATHTFERSFSLLLHFITFLCAIAGVTY